MTEFSTEDIKSAIINNSNCSFVYPSNEEESYITGEFYLDNGDHILYEVPAIFNDDGSMNEPDSLLKLYNFIQYLNQTSNGL